MNNNEKSKNKTTNKSLRFKIGVFFFILVWISPLFIPLVTLTKLTIEWKTALSGFLLVGGPELFGLLSIAFLGKDGFNFIKDKSFTFLKKVAPKAKVSRMRYRCGLLIWLFLFIYGSFVYYAPHLMPGYKQHRVFMNLASDGLFIISLFILGGDFWDKFRALFIYEAKASFPDT